MLQDQFREAGIAINGYHGRPEPEATTGLAYTISGLNSMPQRVVQGDDRFIGYINIGLALFVPNKDANLEALSLTESQLDWLEWTVGNKCREMLNEMRDDWDDLYVYRESSRPQSMRHLKDWRISQMYLRIETK